MALEKITYQSNIQMEELTIISSARMVNITVTEFKLTRMEQYIEESSKIAVITDMDSWGIRIMMSMTVNGFLAANTEKECSRRHQLEELKEDFMKFKKSKKSLKW
jgi:hypothetical protein